MSRHRLRPTYRPAPFHPAGGLVPPSRKGSSLTDHCRHAGPSWYALRFWIELGFKAIKSLGWKWDKTRRTDPARISRHWLVLSVASLLALAYGTRVEDAQDRRIAPGSLRAPPKALAPNHRTLVVVARTGVIRHGIDWLRRLRSGSPLEPRLAAARTLAPTQAQPGGHPSCAFVAAVTYPCQRPRRESKLNPFTECIGHFLDEGLSNRLASIGT